MGEELEPGPADRPPPDPGAWRERYGSHAGSEPAAAQNPLLVSPAFPAAGAPATTERLALAFLAAAIAALVGGLVWAGIVVATGYDLGILALFIGAGTGLTAQRVAGAPVGGLERGLAGAFAAGAIIVGKYVIFVHDVKTAQVQTVPADLRIPVGYLDGHWMSFFVHHFGTIVHGFDWFWIAIAAYAAFRTAGGIAVLGIGRARPRE